MLLSTSQSKSSKNKSKTKRLIKLVFIVSILIILGCLTYDIALNDSLCKGKHCEQLKVAVDLDVEASEDSDDSQGGKEILTTLIEDTLSAQHIDDVEDENKRLLLQRDIQRAISPLVVRKPFNLKNGDLCVLTINPKKAVSKLKIKKCSNYVLKRSITLALNKVSSKKLINKYSFKNTTPEFEVRLSQ